jgi:hypothetical protein
MEGGREFNFAFIVCQLLIAVANKLKKKNQLFFVLFFYPLVFYTKQQTVLSLALAFVIHNKINKQTCYFIFNRSSITAGNE